MFKSTNGGDNWGFYFPPFNNDICAIAIDPLTPTTVYAGIGGGGIYKNLDDGGWNLINTGLDNTYVCALAINPSTPATLYAGTSDGVFKSINGGENWSPAKTGMNDTLVNALAIDPATPSTLYAGTKDGVFKSTNGGGNWNVYNTGLSCLNISAITIDPVTPTTLYAGTSCGIFKSTNSGGTWSEFNTGLTSIQIRALAIDPSIPTTLYAGTAGGVFANSYIGNSYRMTLKSQGRYDGWVLESGEFSRKGGTKNYISKLVKVGDDPADKQFRSILSFGTAIIPDNAVVTKVILKIKKRGVVGTNPMETHNGLVVDIKKNKFYTLPALQINDFQTRAGKLKVGKFPDKLYSGWYRAVLYKGAYAYINVKGRTQLRLRFLLDDNDDNSADILKFYSGNAILANRPKLIIEYHVP